jgi:hypothetical protein
MAAVENLMLSPLPQERVAANEPIPESSAAVNAICTQIRRLSLEPVDVVALINAISNTLNSSNGHIKFHKAIVEELDQLSDAINSVVEGECEGL